MSTEEEYKALSDKLKYGLALAEQRLIEETARREGVLCYGRPDGKVIRVSASELLDGTQKVPCTTPPPLRQQAKDPDNP